ncbi:vWA domain-containing protein [Alsobacter sp. R-9]
MTLFQRFRDDVSGALAIIFALLLVPVLMVVGLAVDYGRVVYARTALQAVVDSTTLAVTTPKYTTSAEVQAAAERIFEAQLRDKYGLTLPTKLQVALQPDGKTVNVEAVSSVKNTVLAAVGMPAMEIAAKARGIRGLDNSVEVALVLDTTYSMSANNKMPTLKSAANLMVDTLTADSAQKVKFAIVPFANYVNVGLTNRNQPWMSGANDYTTTTTTCTQPNTTCQTWTTQPKQTCVNVNCVPKTTCTTTDGVQNCTTTQSCQQQCTTTGTQQVCSVWNKGPQQCTTKTNTFKWSGCVLSRASPNTLTDANPAVPYGALMNKTCTTPITPLTSDKTIVKAAINALTPANSTYVPAGLMWGWNVLSPLAPFAEGAAYDSNNRKPRKTMVLMTDGENTLSYRTTQNDHEGTSRTAADAATATLCTNIKTAGIEVWTIAFQVTDVNVQNMLRTCASSADNFFNASDNASLEAAFKKIAASLQTPYLGQ